MSGTVIFRPRFSLQLKGMVIKMKLRAKKFLALILCVALTIFSSANVLADEKSTNSNQQQIGITAKSDAFPNAYIEVENGTTVAARDGTVQLQNATVTVYYEQTYGKDAEGNTIITDSRLLTEEEVNAIGKENFETGMPSLTREVSNEKGNFKFGWTVPIRYPEIPFPLSSLRWEIGAVQVYLHLITRLQEMMLQAFRGEGT